MKPLKLVILLCSILLINETSLRFAAAEQNPTKPTVTDAISGLLDQFNNYPLVGIAEFHGLRQLGDLYIALIQQPEFARKVGNIVFEFGNAFYQDVINRYVNGGDVPFEQLQRVWTPTFASGLEPMPRMYIDFYRTVREVNADLPEAERLHVWLGDPPLDASNLANYDLESPLIDRDTHFVSVLNERILAMGKKALVIMGAFHLDPAGFPFLLENKIPLPPGFGQNVRQRLEAVHPGQLYVASVYQGMSDATCASEFNAVVADHPVPALISLAGTTLENLLNRPECRDYVALAAQLPAAYLPGWAHGLLYLAPAGQLMMSMYSADDPEISYLDYLAQLASNALQVVPTDTP